MTIAVGDRVPAGKFKIATSDGPADLTTAQLFDGKRVLFFAVPGAFTPTCDARHLPGYLDLADQIRGKGIDTIACMSVNDVFVMKAWGKSANAGDKVLLLADGNGDYTRALGLQLDATGFGMGERSKRFAMVVKNGVVEQLHVETGGEFKVSAADYLLARL
jgi:glutaredoxin/glutathione-dependent peroxiredoxin